MADAVGLMVDYVLCMTRGHYGSCMMGYGQCTMDGDGCWLM